MFYIYKENQLWEEIKNMKHSNSNETLNKKITGCIINDTKKNSPKRECEHTGKKFRKMCKLCWQDKFIEEAIELHGDKFTYDDVKYTNSLTPVSIKCNSCGKTFKQTPSNHLSGKGCRDCSFIAMGLKRRLTTDVFISKSAEMHNNSYDYISVEYVNSRTPVTIKCNTCGKIFEQTPNQHLSGHGCSDCAIQYRAKAISSNTDEFIIKAIGIHGDDYNYQYVKYENAKTKVDIICNKCSTKFLQTPVDHLSGRGCPKCKTSKGELKILKFLRFKNIPYIHQKKYSDCRNPKTNLKLIFDFYIPIKNILIEFDGKQHYKKGCNLRGHIMTDEEFKRQKIRDRIKNEYCVKNNIRLIRISYREIMSIDKILERKLK